MNIINVQKGARVLIVHNVVEDVLTKNVHNKTYIIIHKILHK